jgi:hypothetical protein
MLVASIVVPVLVQAALVLLHGGIAESVAPVDVGGALSNALVVFQFASPVLSAVAGFMFVYIAFPKQAWYIAIVYFPVICGVLLTLWMALAMRMSGVYV